MRNASGRKARKRMFTAPLHRRKEFLNAHVSKELKQKEKKRSMTLKKGFKVKVMRGSFKGKTGAILSVSYGAKKVYVEGITKADARGKDKPIALHPSNLLIISIG